jgi:hypothetical protein
MKPTGCTPGNRRESGWPALATPSTAQMSRDEGGGLGEADRSWSLDGAELGSAWKRAACRLRCKPPALRCVGKRYGWIEVCARDRPKCENQSDEGRSGGDCVREPIPIMPDPTTAASRKAVAMASATARRATALLRGRFHGTNERAHKLPVDSGSNHLKSNLPARSGRITGVARDTTGLTRSKGVQALGGLFTDWDEAKAVLERRFKRATPHRPQPRSVAGASHSLMPPRRRAPSNDAPPGHPVTSRERGSAPRGSALAFSPSFLGIRSTDDHARDRSASGASTTRANTEPPEQSPYHQGFS